MPGEQRRAGYSLQSISPSVRYLISYRNDSHFDCICPLISEIERLPLVDHVIVERFVDGIFDKFVIARCTRLATILVLVFRCEVADEHLLS